MTEPTYAVTLRLKPAQREEILELAMRWDTSMTAACVRAVHEAYVTAVRGQLAASRDHQPGAPSRSGA